MDPVEGLIGVKLTHLVAGVAGGTVRAFLSGFDDWISATAAVVVGSLTAGYLTMPVYKLTIAKLPIPPEASTEHAVGFLVGLTAMMICEGALRFMKGWSKAPKVPPYNGPKL